MDGRDTWRAGIGWMRIENKELFGCSHIQIVWCIKNNIFHYKSQLKNTKTEEESPDLAGFFGRKQWLPLCFLTPGLCSKDQPRSFFHRQQWQLTVSFFSFQAAFAVLFGFHWRKSHYFLYLHLMN